MVCASTEKAGKIAGGFVLLNVASIMTAWRACRTKPLKTADFRTWLACHEMVARRCHVHRDRDRSPRFGTDELAKLLNVSERRARASVRRLVVAGLIEWSEAAIGFPDLFVDPNKKVSEAVPRPDSNGGFSAIKSPTGTGSPDHFRDVTKKVDEAGRAPDLNAANDDIKNSIGGGRGSLAIPRRMLRFLVAGARPALIATVLGLLLRCLSRRKTGWDGRGRCKASWVARVFGVSLRQVKAARRELLVDGWTWADPGDQWAENRWGRAFRINLGWRAPGATSALPPAISGPPSTPPDLQTGNPSGRSENQEPGPDPAGFSIERQGGEDRASTTQPERPPVVLTAAQASPGLSSRVADLPAHTDPVPAGMKPVSALPAPKLADVRIEDLKDTGRLLGLLEQAIARGLITASEADRLRFVGAAEHALAIASNAPALFAYLVLRGCWRYITGEDEDRANARLKAHQRATEPPRISTPPGVGIRCGPSSMLRGPIEPGGLSEDARTVKAIREATIRAGIYRDPWPAFQARYPGWDRARWDRALVELGLGE